MAKRGLALVTLAVLIAIIASVSSSSARAAGASEFSGVVVSNGVPQPGLTVELDLGPFPITTTTDASGAFDLVVTSGLHSLEITGNGVRLLQNSFDLSSSLTNQTLELLPIPLTVTVSDSSGNPIPNATVSAGCPEGAGVSFQPSGAVITNTQGGGSSASTDPSGSATFQTAACQNGTVSASAPGYVASSSATALSTATTVPLTLFRTDETRTFSGTAVDGSGNPLPGLTVSLSGQTTTTAGDGSFSLATPPSISAPLTVTGSTTGNAFSVSAQISFLHDETGQVLTLPIQPFSITVTDSNGTPVPGVILNEETFRHSTGTCQAAAFEIMPGVETTGGASVLFKFGGVTDATGTISTSVLCQSVGDLFRVTPPAGQGLPQENYSLNSPTTAPTDVQLRLPVGSEFSGVVVSNGVPQAGVTVQLSNNVFPYVTTTAADGSYYLDIPGGPYSLSMTGNGVNLVQNTFDLSSSLADQTFELLPPPVSFVVSDASGAPIAGATVAAACSKAPPAFFQPSGVSFAAAELTNTSATTDVSGTAVVRAAGCTGGYSVSAPGYVSISSPVLPSDSTPVPVTLFVAGQADTFSGVAEDANGVPLAGLTVTLSGQSTITGPDGTFSLAALPSDTSQLSVGGSTQSNNFTVTAQISFLHDETGQVLTLPIQPFSITVTDSNGTPVPGVSLGEHQFHGTTPSCQGETFELMPGVQATSNRSTLFNFGGVTDANGTFATTVLCSTVGDLYRISPPTGQGLPEENYSLFSPTTAPTDITVQLPVGSDFSGAVLVSGVPQAGLTVQVLDSVFPFTTTTGADGSFDLEIPAGQHAVSITGNGLNLQQSSLDLSANLSDQTLELQPVPLTVVVSDTSGNPIPDAAVTASCPAGATVPFEPSGATLTLAGGSASSASADSTGTATLNALPCPTGAVGASADGFSSSSVTGVPATAATIPLTLFRVGETEAFSGTAEDGSGNPLPGLTVTLAGQTTTTGDDGSFSLTGPASTGEALTVSGSTPANSFSVTAQISLLHNETGQVLTLPIEPFSITVSDSNGAPIPGVSLTPRPGKAGVVGACVAATFPIMPGVDASGNNSQFTFGGTTGADGKISTTVLCSSVSSVLLVQPPAGQGFPVENFLLGSPTTAPTNVPITLASLSGTLADGNGQSLAGQTIAVKSGASTVTQAITATDGSFALTASPATYDVGVSGSLGDPTTYSVTVPGVDLTSGIAPGTFTLPTETVVVNVTAGGVAVAGAKVTAPCATTTFPLLGGTANGSECPAEVTDSTGTATIELLPTGPLTLTITPPAGSSLPPATVSVTPAPGTVSVSAQLGHPPVFTSASTATFAAGKTAAFTIKATGTPTPSLSVAGALPGGVTFVAHANGTATLSGTPSAAASGSYPLTIAANNGLTTNQAFTLIVTAAPAFTSPNKATFAVGQAGTFTVHALGYPVPTLKLTGTLPTGVTLTDNHDGTATLTGTPTKQGSSTFTLTAKSTLGTAAQTFTLTVGQAPAITSSATATFAAGASGSFTVRTTGSPTAAITRSGALPAGLVFTDKQNGTATLSGTATRGGVFPVTIVATNAAGQTSQLLTVTVNQAPAITSPSAATFTTGQAGAFTVTTTPGWPAATSLTESGKLPTGVTFVAHTNGTATLAGTPAAGSGGTYKLTIVAANGLYSVSQTLTLTVKQPPAFTTGNTVSFSFGKGGTFTIRTSGYPVATLTAVGALHSGLTLTDNHDGTATLTASSKLAKGTYSVTVSAANAAGSQSQTITVTSK